MKIEQRDLEYFVVVAEYGNLGRAAEALQLSQPALSMSLRRLERVTGAKIVRRVPKGIELTDAGATLLKHVSRLRVAHGDILREVSDIGQARAGHIRVGTGTGMSDLRLASACGELLNEAPGVTIATTGGNQKALLHALRAGELDFLVTVAVGVNAEDLAQEPVADDEFVVYCSRRHRLARSKRAGTDRLVNERWVLAEGNMSSARLHGAFEERGLPPPKVALTSLIPELRLRTVAATNLLGYSSRDIVQDASERLALAIVRVQEWDVARRRVAIVHRKGAYLSPVARRLIELVKSAVPAGAASRGAGAR